MINSALADAINTPDFTSRKLTTLDKFKHGKMVDLKNVSNLFGGKNSFQYFCDLNST